MTKKSGIGDRLYVHGVDLSGDIGAVQRLSSPLAHLTVTGIDKSAIERIAGLKDGAIGFNAWFNPASGQSHPVLSALPTTDILVSYFKGQTAGDPAAMLLAKQVNYDGTRGADGSLSLSVEALAAAGMPLLWGEQYTAGKVTHSSATNVTGIDGGATAAAIDIDSMTAASPTEITTDGAHGLVSGDTVTIAGVTGGTPGTINGDHVVTVTGATTFTVAVDLSGGAGTGGTVTKTSTNYGATAAIHVFSLGSGTVTGKLQHSADDSTYADITGLTFTGVGTGAVPTDQMLETTATLPIRRYVRFASTGTFTNAVIAVIFARHLALAI